MHKKNTPSMVPIKLHKAFITPKNIDIYIIMSHLYITKTKMK